MHLGVYWYIKNPSTPREPVMAALKEVLKGYSWVRPLPGYYVLQVGGESDRQLIREGLTAYAQANPGRVQFLITPLMNGKYTGFLPKDTWQKLNDRTAP